MTSECGEVLMRECQNWKQEQKTDRDDRNHLEEVRQREALNDGCRRQGIDSPFQFLNLCRDVVFHDWLTLLVWSDTELPQWGATGVRHRSPVFLSNSSRGKSRDRFGVLFCPGRTKAIRR